MTTNRMPALRPELTELPRHMRNNLLIDERGYPIPWFVAYVDGKPEFRAMDAEKLARAIRERLCWVCGGGILGAHKTFVVGPMCCVSRTSSEPPSHKDCAVWSAINCPFLSRPNMTRRGAEEMKAMGATTAGEFIDRNPGVTALWTTRNYKVWSPGDGQILLRMGEPEAVAWYAQGRPATRAEIMASIESGLPALLKLADGDDEVMAIARETKELERWLPER